MLLGSPKVSIPNEDLDPFSRVCTAKPCDRHILDEQHFSTYLLLPVRMSGPRTIEHSLGPKESPLSQTSIHAVIFAQRRQARNSTARKMYLSTCIPKKLKNELSRSGILKFIVTNRQTNKQTIAKKFNTPLGNVAERSGNTVRRRPTDYSLATRKLAVLRLNSHRGRPSFFTPICALKPPSALGVSSLGPPSKRALLPLRQPFHTVPPPTAQTQISIFRDAYVAGASESPGCGVRAD